ncbi:MAG: iron-containing redox enzyme family protein [Aquabacterium sp.]|uniref:iron-containing redox enzyme family protein n=1 Tax=Aquabacterium sp. TaxID=1872578 RepID=UPI0025C15C0E|nr:iron-containing redox enzyme family protein [Aquabacterium sp.]MBI3381925.1 iron-containing redox enzyme family protein [Aquabacterium sp.]
MNELIKQLDETINREWAVIKAGRFWTQVMSEPVPGELYRLMMEQIYHYTRYNSVNQAAAALRTSPERRRLLKFVYKHAAEELGHEAMVLHDLKSIDLLDNASLQDGPLPPTAALIAYLTQVAMEKGAVARLGYSYWAESCYDHIDALLKKFRSDLQLVDANMTFFVAHSEIDAGHSAEVLEAMRAAEPTEQEKADIVNVARTTLYLTGQILERVALEHAERQQGDLKLAA